MLGLLALHLLAQALAEFYELNSVHGVVRCDNEAALGQAKIHRRRVRTSAKQADVLRAIRTVKASACLKFQYEWIRLHQDKRKLWHQLSLAAQLNVRCDEHAKAAVLRSMTAEGTKRRESELLPREKAAVIIDGVKLTEDPAKAVRFALGEVEARRFYTTPLKKGLGWTVRRFEQVDFRARDAALSGRSEGFGLWLCKQQSGFCATRHQMARIQDLLDDRCPNCLQAGERASHLNVCPDDGRRQLFADGVNQLQRWMETGNRTDPEIAYWVPKFLLLRGSTRFGSLGAMSTAMQRLANSQDEIGWRKMLEGMVSKEFREIQTAHCMLAPCAMNGDDWVKQFVGKLLLISHSQWIFRNYTLHERQRGFLALKAREQVLTDIRSLMDTDPDQVPASSRYLLELDFSQLVDSGHEEQAYWVVAVQAAKKAGRRAWRRVQQMGGSD